MKKQMITISETILQRNSLFWPGQGSLAIEDDRKNIFIGVGIAVFDKLSTAVPFDIIGFMLSAEFIKRRIPNSHVFLLIADQHAWLANNLSKTKARKFSTLMFNVVGKIIKSLKLKSWTVIMASNLFSDEKSLSYENLEIRDINHFFHNHQVGVKIGWKFNTGSTAHKTDEQHFDAKLNKINLNSVFVRPAETFNNEKPQESPYICTDQNSRIVLSANEHVVEKMVKINEIIDKNRFQAVQNHLRRITILFEMLLGDFPPKTPLEEKIKMIFDKIFN